jgi:hypothetical protein
MSIESESFLEEARKAFAAAHRPPMSERFDAIMQAFEVSCRCR